MSGTTTDDSGLGGRAVRGAASTLGGQAVRIVVLLASTVLLARILSPADFGLMSIVLSIVAFGELFRDFGLSTASAREIGLTRGQKSNLFWINTGLGVVLGAVFFFAAAPIGALFGEPSLTTAIQITSSVFVLNGLATQYRAELNRQLRFLALSAVDTVPAVVGLVLAIVWSTQRADFSVLIVQQLTTSAGGLILAVAMVRWLPGLPSRSDSVGRLFRFSAGLFGTQLIAYFTKNIDNLALGYIWGTGPLGLYSRAYQILMMPLNQVAAPLTRVMVPVLTRLQDDRDRFQDYLLRSQIVGGVGLGIFYGLCIGLGGPLVEIVFGPKWSEMVPIFQILAVGGIFRALVQMSFWIFLAKGFSGAQFRFYLVSQPVIVVLILAGLPWGAVGVAVGHSVGYTLNWVLALWWCGRATSTPVAALFRSGLLNVLFFALPAAGLGAAATLLLPGSAIGALLAGVAAFAVYLVVAAALSRHVREVVGVLLTVLRKFRRR
jgi:PST family polysaccharide transporter